jgi:hypothetical protein
VNALNVNLGVAAVIVWPKEDLLAGLELPLNHYTREDGDVGLCSLEGLRDVKLGPLLFVLVPFLISFVERQLMKEGEQVLKTGALGANTGHVKDRYNVLVIDPSTA